MKKGEFVRVFGGVIVLLVILLGFFAVVQVASKSPLWSNEGAAWVQAVGSIAAILGAYHLAQRSHEKVNAANEITILRDEIRRLRIARACFRRVIAFGDHCLDSIKQRDMVTIASIRADFIRDIRQIMNDLPLIEMPEVSVAQDIIGTMAMLEAVEAFVRCYGGEDEVVFRSTYETLMQNGLHKNILLTKRVANSAFHNAGTEINSRTEQIEKLKR